MILGRAPFRISFAGGGTDLRAFTREHPGAVLSTSIDKYMYIMLHPYFHDQIRIKYSKLEDVSRVEDIRHPLVRECLKRFRITRGIEIASMRLASSGYMLEFRYRILDANKAQPLFDAKSRPILKDDASGFESVVPSPPTTGSLRSTYDAKAGRTYFMFFANPSRFLKAGSTVTV